MIADQAVALQAASSVALRTRPTGPVGVLVLSAEDATEGGAAKSTAPLPLPTPGAVRVAAQLRRAGHKATARWRLVICRPVGSDQVDDAAAILEAACGCVTAVTDALAVENESGVLPACDLAVGVLPEGAPSAAREEANVVLAEQARSALVLQLSDPGLGGALPLAGICPPPDWANELDALDEFLSDD